MMVKRRNIILSAILALSLSIIAGIINNHSAYAEMAPVAQKWIFSQYYHCLQSSDLIKEINRNNHRNDPLSTSIFSGLAGKQNDYSYLPSAHYFTSVGVDSINCPQVLTGIDGKISGVLEAAGTKYNATWADLRDTDEVLQKLGYKSENADTVVNFKITLTENSYSETSDVFSLFTGETRRTDYPPVDRGSATIQGTKGSDGRITWKVIESNLFNDIKVKIDDSNILTVTLDTPGYISGCSSNGDFSSGAIQLTDDIETSKTNIVNAIGGYTANSTCTNNTMPGETVQLSTTIYYNTYTFSANVDNLIDQGNGTIFKNDGSRNTALQSLISLGHSFSTLQLTEDERYDLYLWYLESAIPNLMSDERIKCQNYENNSSLKNGLQEIHLKNGDKWYKYYVSMSNVDTLKTFRDLKPAAEFTTISLQEIIDWMNGHSAEEISEEECNKTFNPDWKPDSSGGISNTTVTDAEEAEVNCFNAAGSLGWILCPVITFAQHTIYAIYDSITSNFLEFRAEWLNMNGQGEAVYKAWQVFQSFANVIFVIVLLVVIFSQLTGVGIDNLGIKRVLPKLIIAAVLINLSYIICMLFVDLSNITGAGLNRIFSDIAVSIPGGSSASTGSAVLTTAVTGAVTLAVGSLSAFAVGISGGVIVIPLVLGLITTLIGVLFFFILLGTRQAAIIMLTVASPIAFACYMLPNTKTVFDKWLKIFEALLLLFPICGLLMGGSAFASKVLLTVDQGFLGALIAMLVGVIPFFFIPSLLRGAFSAMGNLGARISGFGQNVGRRIQGAAANSDMVRDTETRLRAGLDRNGNQNALGRFRSRIASGESRFSRIPGLQRTASRAQARGLVNYEKWRDELDFASRPDLITSEAEARRFGRRQAAADAELVSSGIANRTGDLKDFDANNPANSTFEEGTLAYAAMEAARSGDVERQYAITERMLASGHHGAEAYRQVLESLERDGNVSALENFAKAGKNSRNIGDLKSGARSTFDYINGIADNKVLSRDANGNLTGAINAGQSLHDYTRKVKYSNMSESQVIGMDREELSRAAKIIQQKRSAFNAALSQAQNDAAAAGREYTAEERAALEAQFFTDEDRSLISQANKAFRNDRLRGGAKESNQMLAAEIAGLSQEEQRRIVGETINVDHRNGSNIGISESESGTPV